MTDFLHSLDQLFLWTMKSSLYMAALALLLLALQPLLRRLIAPRWICWLWVVLIIKLMVPWEMPMPGHPVDLAAPLDALWSVPSESALSAPAPADSVQASVAPASHAVDVAASAAWLRIGSLGWFGCALIGVIFTISSILRFRGRKSRIRPVTSQAVLDVLENCKQEVGVRTPINVLVDDEAATPAILGFLHPRILLPGFVLESFSKTELRMIFLHELGHLKRGDVFLNLMMMLLRVVHWFNPMVWLAVAQLKVLREDACDAFTLSLLADGENKIYGSTILRLIESAQQQPHKGGGEKRRGLNTLLPPP